MATLIKKEIRLLLPAWIVAMLLAILPGVLQVALVVGFQPGWGFYEGPDCFFILLIFAVGVLLLGINSFGQELSSGTFSSLLSQPAERRRIWLVKIAILAIAFLSVWLTAVVLVWVQSDIFKWYGQSHAFWESFASIAVQFVTLATLLAFSGGLWTTLLFRQTTGAFWFTLLTPLAIIFGVSTLLENWTGWDQHINTVIVLALVLYSVAGFFWARRLFLRAQDLQWAGGEISIPWRGKIFQSAAVWTPSRPRHRLLALAWKEIQLHQSSFVIAAILLALHLAAFSIRKFHGHVENPDLQFVLTSIWILWLLMPLLIGATAIAEERRLGILPAQLCLPVSRRLQLFLKFSIALVLSLLFGGLLPWLLERTPDFNLWIYAVAAGIFVIAFFASSLARTTLQAIGLAVVVAIAIYLYEITVSNAVIPPGYGRLISSRLFGLMLLKHYISAIVLLLVLGWLTFWNFKQLHQNWKFWASNIIAVLSAFVLTSVLVHAIYFRAWELVMPLESRGPVRISNSARVKTMGDFDTLYALLPDGRLWVETLAYDRKPGFYGSTLVLAPGQNHQEFIGNSNWVDLAMDEAEALGVKSDGTLWNIQNRAHSIRPTQIGSDKDWSQVARNFGGFLLLKRDGTLWALVTRPNYGLRANQNLKRLKPALRSPVATNSIAKTMRKPLPLVPLRISDDTNWASLYSTHMVAYARKNDGVNWVWRGMTGTNHTSVLIQETNVDNQWSDMQFGGDLSYVEVKTNGDLWYHNEQGWQNRPGPRISPARSIQLAQGMKWKTAGFGSFGPQTILAIRDDGTLWAIPLVWGYPDGRPHSPVQLGNHSDWVAIDAGFALASDGSLWSFPGVGGPLWNQTSDHTWLAPSRRPVNLGNIFQDTENNTP